MDLQTRKLTFIQEFLRLQSEEIISKLEFILEKQKAIAFENKLKPMSLKKFNKEIDQAMEDSDNDKLSKATALKENYK